MKKLKATYKKYQETIESIWVSGMLTFIVFNACEGSYLKSILGLLALIFYIAVKAVNYLSHISLTNYYIYKSLYKEDKEDKGAK